VNSSVASLNLMRSGARSQRKLARVSVKGSDMGHLIAKKAPDVVIFEKGIPWDIQNGASDVSPVVGVDDINPFSPFCLAPFLQNNGVGQM